MILRFNKTNRDIFEAIRDGRKRVETRAATVKYADLEPGETLTFVCDGERFDRTISAVSHFASIDALLEGYAPSQIHPDLTTAEELRALYHSFPGYEEKIAAHGLVAIELEVVS
jgi:ASC-1-like (ASCH) protein